MKTTVLPLLLAAVLLSGCKTDDHGYRDPGGIHFDKPSNATLSDLDRLTEELVGKILASDRFRADYEKTKKSLKGNLPAMQIGNFVNNASMEDLGGDNPRNLTPKLDVCRDKAKEALQESFRFVDDPDAPRSYSEILNEGLQKGVEVGLRGKKNLHPAKKGRYLQPDYQVFGILDPISDGTRHTFNFAIHVFSIKTHEEWTYSARIAKE